MTPVHDEFPYTGRWDEVKELRMSGADFDD
jgi:hypothetical protein